MKKSVNHLHPQKDRASAGGGVQFCIRTREGRVFWLLVSMFYLYDMRRMFLPALPGVFEKCDRLERMMHLVLPDLVLHLVSSNNSNNIQQGENKEEKKKKNRKQEEKRKQNFFAPSWRSLPGLWEGGVCADVYLDVA